MEDQFRFAPYKCTFKTEDFDGSSGKSFVLFDASVNSCQQEFSPLKFSLSYKPNEKSWDLSYVLFLFNGQVDSRYTLECDVNTCYNNDVMENCQAVAEICDQSYSQNSGLWSSTNEVKNQILIYPQTT